jgi:hypothetical protein
VAAATTNKAHKTIVRFIQISFWAGESRNLPYIANPAGRSKLREISGFGGRAQLTQRKTSVHFDSLECWEAAQVPKAARIKRVTPGRSGTAIYETRRV